MTDALAIRFADLWAVDHHQMVDEIYAPTIHMESMAGHELAPVEGADQLHALEDRLAAMIPQHRHELVRVIAGERVSCLETIVVGPTTREYAPACVWWWVDGAGGGTRSWSGLGGARLIVVSHGLVLRTTTGRAETSAGVGAAERFSRDWRVIAEGPAACWLPVVQIENVGCGLWTSTSR